MLIVRRLDNPTVSTVNFKAQPLKLRLALTLTLTLTNTGGTVLTLMLGYRIFKETKTGPNPNPDPNRYRRRCPDPSDHRTLGLSSSHQKRRLSFCHPLCDIGSFRLLCDIGQRVHSTDCSHWSLSLPVSIACRSSLIVACQVFSGLPCFRLPAIGSQSIATLASRPFLC